MKRRFTRLPIVSLALVAGSLLLGFALAPVDAQQVLSNGQVTVRSDGAVYLIENNVRRWVATVVISDEELNAYPEAQPIYTGLVPFGSASAGTAASPGVTASPGTTTTGSQPAQTTGTPGTAVANDPTLAEPPPPDPAGRTKPTGGTCPSTHQIKGATLDGVKVYYDIDRPDYPNVTPEECFTAGGDARAAGYIEIKKHETGTP